MPEVILQRGITVQSLHEIVSSAVIPKKVFKNLFNNKNKIMMARTETANSLAERITETVVQSPQIMLANTPDSSTFILKYNKNKVRFIEHYQHPYLMNSMIRTLITNEVNGIHCVAYALYYYWFLKLDTIEDTASSVITDLEEMISVITNKANTFYREVNTERAIRILGERITLERLMSASYVHQGINFRR